MNDLQVEWNGDVLVLVLNRPDKLNALSVIMRAKLVSELANQLAERKARAILLTGAGKGFCSGADLDPDTMLNDTGTMEVRIQAGINQAIRLMHDVPIPVIAAVNGAAAGAGSGLALAGDFLLVSSKARLHFSFANIGLVMDGGVSHALTTKIGSARTASLVMLGGSIDAETALNWGLAHKVFPQETFAEDALQFAQTVASRPTIALGLIKQQIKAAQTMPLDEVLRFEAACQGKAVESEDFREGVTAFNEKRSPVFRGQ